MTLKKIQKGSEAANSWLIMGTSSGFGRTLTELALERGDHVVATVRKPSVLDDLKELWKSPSCLDPRCHKSEEDRIGRR
jgi:short-subunit dehydrogenase